jgi:predicted DNA-binding ribbon-helix-helix protein
MTNAEWKRSVVIAGRKTSVSLEDAFWQELAKIARARKVNLSTLIQEIDSQKSGSNLSSAIRLFVLAHLRAQHAVEAENGNAPSP